MMFFPTVSSSSIVTPLSAASSSSFSFFFFPPSHPSSPLSHLSFPTPTILKIFKTLTFGFLLFHAATPRYQPPQKHGYFIISNKEKCHKTY
ncbi:hypothetical protein LguiA_009418 [Lonicera macranthoides]